MTLSFSVCSSENSFSIANSNCSIEAFTRRSIKVGRLIFSFGLSNKDCVIFWGDLPMTSETISAIYILDHVKQFW